jgi:hypothetical protein
MNRNQQPSNYSQPFFNADYMCENKCEQLFAERRKLDHMQFANSLE